VSGHHAILRARPTSRRTYASIFLATTKLQVAEIPEEPTPQYFLQLPNYKLPKFPKNRRLNISCNYQTTSCPTSRRTDASIFLASTRLQVAEIPEEPTPQYFLQLPDYKVSNLMKN